MILSKRIRKVKTITQTCYACPSQWEGVLENGDTFYIRYRWGYLSLDIPFDTTVFSKQLGDNLHGILHKHQLIFALLEQLDFSTAVWSDIDWEQHPV